jgi:DNA mismatch repair protein MutS
MSNIYLCYLELTTKHQQQYGPKTVVFYLVGSFYEMYSLMHPITKELSTITPIQEVITICELNNRPKHITLGKGNNPHLPIPPFPIHPTDSEIVQWLHTCPECMVMMAGVRDYNMEKYVEKLIEAGYTIAVYDQEKDEQGNVIARPLQHIYTPGTYLSHSISTSLETPLSNYIMTIWIEKRLKGTKMICGISILDIITAESYLFEYETHMTLQTLQHTSYDELERILTIYKPKEILFLSDRSFGEEILEETMRGNNLHTSEKEFSFLSPFLQQYSSTIRTYDISDKTNIKLQNCLKETYRNKILLMIFPQYTEIYSIQEFQLYTVATQAFCFLVDFIYELQPEILTKIQFPKCTNTTTRLLLVNRTLTQLNIIPTKHGHGHLSSVETFLNKCSTPMGRRLFKYQLCHPTFDVIWLQQQYTYIAKLLDTYTQEDIVHIRKELSTIKDLEKCLRQLVLQQLSPNGLDMMVTSMETYWQIHMHHPMISCSIPEVFPPDVQENIPLLVKHIHSNIRFLQPELEPEICDQLCDGVDTSLDTLRTTKHIIYEQILSIQRALETFMCQENIIKIHETEKQGISLQLTKKRAKNLKLQIQHTKDPIHLYEEQYVQPQDICIQHATSTNDDIEFPLLRDLIKQHIILQQDIKRISHIVYQQILQEIVTTWYPCLVTINSTIAMYDVLLNKAYLVREYNYCRPNIPQYEHEEDISHSFVSCIQLRHCLIEHIQTNEIYVPNDLQIGGDVRTSSSHIPLNGMLVSGYNGIGKTSLIRALGISIIMAQSGMYVPAKEFTYVPYHSMYCHIEKNDNLFKHLSTFQLEISEIRVILQQANAYSLVLADEIMNSTEIQSGISIMISFLEELSKRHISFLIATHFNQLSDFEEIRELVKYNGLQLTHMEVMYDATTHHMIYDRILRNGLGPRCYGLEVAKSLLLSSTVLERAHLLRKKYFLGEGTLPSLLSLPSSKYSKQVLYGICEQCGISIATEIHHILEQHKADTHGFIDHVHKHHPGNLQPLCQTCHQQIHQERHHEQNIENIPDITIRRDAEGQSPDACRLLDSPPDIKMSGGHRSIWDPKDPKSTAEERSSGVKEKTGEKGMGKDNVQHQVRRIQRTRTSLGKKKVNVYP